MQTPFDAPKEYHWTHHHPKDFLFLHEFTIRDIRFETSLRIDEQKENVELEANRVYSDGKKSWIIYHDIDDDQVLVNNDELEPHTLYAIDLRYTDYRVTKVNTRLPKRLLRSERPLPNFF